ncbi:UNVERIFIED_CONTAM: hypothetical protein NCL1_53500 [Trichonephila clavipes]
MQRLPGAIFYQDNARPHTTKVSQDCLRTVTTLPCPTLSPDFSPILPIWDHFGRRVGNPTSLNELEIYKIYEKTFNTEKTHLLGSKIMELFELFQLDFSHVFIITILLLTIFPVRSLALFCLTCLFPIFHPMCCKIFHTCCKGELWFLFFKFAVI